MNKSIPSIPIVDPERFGKAKFTNRQQAHVVKWDDLEPTFQKGLVFIWQGSNGWDVNRLRGVYAMTTVYRGIQSLDAAIFLAREIYQKGIDAPR